LPTISHATRAALVRGGCDNSRERARQVWKSRGRGCIRPWPG